MAIVLPQVDLNYWLGGPDSSPCRFSVVLKKGYYEVWDLSCPNGERFNRLAAKAKALQQLALWAKQPITLATEIEPPPVFSDRAPVPHSERRWGVSGVGQGRLPKGQRPQHDPVPDLPDEELADDLDEA